MSPSPELDDDHEEDSRDDVSTVAEHVAIVIEHPIWILAEVVIVAGVQVPGALGGLLVVVDQLEHWQCVVDAGQEDQVEEQLRAQLPEVGEIFGIMVKHSHVENRNFFSK